MKMSPPQTAADARSPAKLRSGIFGHIARTCPIAGRGDWLGDLNADFEDGSRPWLGDLCVPDGSLLLHLHTWPEPYARLRKRRDAPWSVHEPYLDIAHGIIAVSRREPGRSFVDWLPQPPPAATPGNAAPQAGRTDWTRRAIERIPQDVRRKLAPFRFCQWALLRLAARNPAILDLLDSNPALAWALASARVFFDHPPREMDAEIVGRVGHRQRDVAAWLGFPPTEASVRLLRKVPPDSCGAIPLLELRALARDAAAAEKLRHLPEISAIAIFAVGSGILGSSLTPAALEQIVAEIARIRNAQEADGNRPAPAQVPGPTIAHLLDDTAHMAQMLPGARPPRTVTSIDTLRRRHDELVERFLELTRPRPRPPAPPPAPALPRAPRRRPARLPRAFPPPPYPAGNGIAPITDTEALNTEGREQHNCVGIYADRVFYGTYYVYKVTVPSRATLSVRRDAQGPWRIDELAGPHNRPAGFAVRQHVAHWFEECTRPKPRNPPPQPAPPAPGATPPETRADPILPGL